MAGERIGEGFVEARLDTTKLRQDAAQVEKTIGDRFKATGQQLSQVGKTLTTRVTAPILAMGTAIVKSAGNFESSMNQVRAVTGATGEEFDNLRGLAQELGRTTQFSASEAADAMYFLASAGFDTTEVMEAMPGVLNLAAAAQMDLATATDIASNILSAFGLEATELDRVNDALVKTFQSTNTNVQQLGEAMKFAAPVAAGLGVDMEDVAAAIGLMGNAGIQGGMAGTSLRMAMTALAQETGPAADVMARLGINAMDTEGNLKPLDEIVRQLADSGASTADMMQLFGQRAGPAMMALVSQGSDALKDLGAEIRTSGGIAEEVAGIQMEGFNGAMARLRSAVEGAAIAIGDAGLLSSAANFAETLARWAQNLAETNPALLTFVTMVAGTAAAVGPAVWAVGGMVKGFVALGAALNPVTLALGAVAVGVGMFVKSRVEATATLNEYVAAVQADTEATDASTEAMDRNTRQTVFNRLEKQGLIADARALGLSVSDVVDAVMGEEAAMTRVSEQMWAKHEAGEALGMNAIELQLMVENLAKALGVESDALSDAEVKARDLAESQAELEGSFLDTAHAAESGMTNAMYNLEAAHGEAAQAARDGAGASGDLQGGLHDLEMQADDSAGGMDEVTNAIEEYLDAVRRATDPVFAVLDAVEKVDQAQQNYIDTLGDSESTQRDVEDAAIDLMKATLELERAAIDGDLSYGEFALKLRDWVREGKITEEQAGLIRDRVDDARESAEGYEGAYNADLTASVDQPSINRAISAIDYAARSRVVPLNLSIRGNANDQRFNHLAGARAGGGPVTAGRTYLVGEEGPELWTASQSGTIIPTGPTLGLLGADGGSSRPMPSLGQMGSADSRTFNVTQNIYGTPDPVAQFDARERLRHLALQGAY